MRGDRISWAPMDDALTTPPAPPAPPTAPDAPHAGVWTDLNRDVACVRCGYSLRGLQPDGACPECGMPIARTLEGDLLAWSAPEYLASLHRGVVLVLAAIIGQLLLIVLGIAVVAAASIGAPGGQALSAFVNLASLGLSLALAAGWWLLSSPDPAMMGQNTGDTPRKVVRITVLIGVGAALVHAIATAAPSIVGGQGGIAALAIIGFADLLASVVGFFAQMLYLRWLAPRLPSERIGQRARTLMWLGPLLMTVGALLLLLGPLIALVLYWNLLEQVRKELKRIRAEQSADPGPLAPA